ncbi:MAG TPA: AIR synthase-related protein, partial [Solirubrobacteraceae bacterium]
FASPGDAIALAGPFTPSLDASELAKLWGRELPGALAEIDLAATADTLAAVRDAVRSGSVSSAHDIAEGGLAVALAECAIASGLGAEVVLDSARADGGAGAPGAVDRFSLLFGEATGGFVLSGPRESLEALGSRLPVRLIGSVGGERLSISVDGESALDAAVPELAGAHEHGLRPFFP